MTMFKKIVITSTALVSFILVSKSVASSQSHNLLVDNQHNQTREHQHKMMEIPAGQPVPKVDLVVYKDAMKGWNLQAKVVNFNFAPESINKAAKSGEGHAHLYVNGQKITRLYSSWYYLENLKPGKNEVTVSLNANSHEALAQNGKMIADTEIIEVPATANQPKKHSH